MCIRDRQGNYSFSLPSDLQEHFIEYLSRVNEECCDEVDNKMQGVVPVSYTHLDCERKPAGQGGSGSETPATELIRQ